MNSPLPLFKWPQNCHKQGAQLSHVKWSMFAPCPANLFEIFKKIMQKLKVVIGLIPFCEAHVYIYSISTKIPFSMHHVKNMMWCDSTRIIYIYYIIVTTHNTIWWTNNLKVAYTIHKVWSTVVWPKLPKFITNSKLLKIFWNLHVLMASSYIVSRTLSMRIIKFKKLYFYIYQWPGHSQIINLNKQSFYTNPLSKFFFWENPLSKLM